MALQDSVAPCTPLQGLGGFLGPGLARSDPEPQSAFVIYELFVLH